MHERGLARAGHDVLLVDLATRQVEVLRRVREVTLDPGDISEPERLEWKGSHLAASVSPDGRFLATTCVDDWTVAVAVLVGGRLATISI